MITNKSFSVRLGHTHSWPFQTLDLDLAADKKLTSNKFDFSRVLNNFFNTFFQQPLFQEAGIIFSHSVVSVLQDNIILVRLFYQDSKALDFYGSRPQSFMKPSSIRISSKKIRSTRIVKFSAISRRPNSSFLRYRRRFLIIPSESFKVSKIRRLRFRSRRYVNFRFKRSRFLMFSSVFEGAFSRTFRSYMFRFVSRFISISLLRLFGLNVYFNFTSLGRRASTSALYANFIVSKLYNRYLLGDILNPIIRRGLAGYRGLSIFCKGRFTRAQIASKKFKTRGKLSYSTVFVPLDYVQKVVTLKYGSCNLSIWIRHLQMLKQPIIINKRKYRPFKSWSKSRVFNPNLRRFASYSSKLSGLDSVGGLFWSYAFPAQRFRRLVVRSSSYGYVTDKAIEAFRKCLSPYFRKKLAGSSRFFIFCYASKLLTKKPAEVRMGGGKGAKIRGYVSAVRPGQILFEVLMRDISWSLNTLLYASKKLPVKVTVISILKTMAHNDFYNSKSFNSR